MRLTHRANSRNNTKANSWRAGPEEMMDDEVRSQKAPWAVGGHLALTPSELGSHQQKISNRGETSFMYIFMGSRSWMVEDRLQENKGVSRKNIWKTLHSYGREKVAAGTWVMRKSHMKEIVMVKPAGFADRLWDGEWERKGVKDNFKVWGLTWTWKNSISFFWEGRRVQLSVCLVWASLRDPSEKIK